jgi:hypothetical protein
MKQDTRGHVVDLRGAGRLAVAADRSHRGAAASRAAASGLAAAIDPPGTLMLAASSGIVRMTIDLGDREVVAVLVGVSSRAMEIGITVPVGYVNVWNRASGQDGATYSALEVEVRAHQQIDGFSKWLADAYGLALRPRT